MMKKWELSDDGEFMYDGEYHSKRTVVKILNNLERQVKTDKQIFKGYEEKFHKMKTEHDIMEEHFVNAEIIEDDDEMAEPPSYYNGKEEAYLRVIDDNIDRITALELEKLYYEMEIMKTTMGGNEIR